MSGRMITYDEIVLEIVAQQNLSPSERVEVLEFIHDFKQEIAAEVLAKMPAHIRSKVDVRLT